MDDEKSKSKSVSLLPSIWEKVEQVAASRYGGNRSIYIRELIERDLNNNTALPPTDPTLKKPILALIRSRAAGIEHLYHTAYQLRGGEPDGFDERVLLSRLLEQSLYLIAQNQAQDFKACTISELSDLLSRAKNFTTTGKCTLAATDYVRRPETIAGRVAQQKQFTQKYPPKSTTQMHQDCAG
jgi:hypothetical protein